MLKIDLNNITNSHQSVINTFSQVLKPHLEAISKGIKIFLENAPSSIYELSKYGWYIDFDIVPGKIIELGELLKNGESKDVDDYLISYYSENLKLIEEELKRNYPSRELILNEVFHNYRNKNFYSSMVLLMTQIDGMCYDNTKKLFFKNDPSLRSKKIHQPEFLKELEENPIGLFDLFMSPIIEPTGINEHISRLDNFPIRLNRHEILHGIDTNYGTEINNLKVISMAKYINDILRND